jgi:adenylate cyclase class 2
MYEVELKVAVDHEAVRDRLSSLGADRGAAVEQVDTYFEHPVRNFAETGEALRIRFETRDGDTDTRVTYKGPLVESASKTREERETDVEDGDTMERIMETLGFDRFETVEKHRERFAHGEYTVTLDTVAGLGEYVEVETEAEAVEPAREGAVALLRDLGLDPDAQIRTSYLGLLLGDGPDNAQK